MITLAQILYAENEKILPMITYDDIVTKPELYSNIG